MARFIFYALLAYLLYKLIFSFIIPIFLTSKKMKEQFNKAKQQMEDQYHQQSGQQQDAGQQKTSNGSAKIGEYIEFEEIRKP